MSVHIDAGQPTRVKDANCNLLNLTRCLNIHEYVRWLQFVINSSETNSIACIEHGLPNLFYLHPFTAEIISSFDAEDVEFQFLYDDKWWLEITFSTTFSKN